MLEFRMPQFGMGMTDGTIIAWHKAEGEGIVAGEPLCDVEAAKTTVEVAAPTTGTLSRILVPADVNVPVNTPIAIIDDATTVESASAQAPVGEVALAGEAGVSTAPKASPLARRAAERDGVDLAQIAGSGTRGRIVAADVARAAAENKVQVEPRARRAAKQLGLDLAIVAGSGPNGRITEEDVRAYTAPLVIEASSAPARTGAREVPHSTMRRTIARRLTESKQTVPHFYLKANCDVGALLALRAQVNAGRTGPTLSVNDFVVRAVALALRRVPQANVSWGEAAMREHDCVDVAIAVATPRGLLTPVVRAVDEKPISALSTEIRALAERARAGKLLPDEYEGGSTSVSNLGMYGTEEFAAIINPPQASIFAIGAAEERAVVRDGTVVPAKLMTVTLSVDHRAVDGAIGAELLAAFKALVEQPALILI